MSSILLQSFLITGKRLKGSLLRYQNKPMVCAQLCTIIIIRTYTGVYTEIFLYAYCKHKNCRFGEVSFQAPVYKSSCISATQRPTCIRNKFGTNVEKGRLVRNPQKYWIFFGRLMVPFRVDGHIFSHEIFLTQNFPNLP